MPDEKTPPTGTPRSLEQRPRLVPRPVQQQPQPAPPVEPPPSVATVHNLCCGIAGQIHGLRTDVDKLEDLPQRVAAIVSAELTARLPPTPSSPPPSLPSSEILYVPALPTPDSLTPVPGTTPRPSRMAAAAKGTSKWGARVLWAVGAVSAVGQIVAAFKPQYAGPIGIALKALGSIFGAPP